MSSQYQQGHIQGHINAGTWTFAQGGSEDVQIQLRSKGENALTQSTSVIYGIIHCLTSYLLVVGASRHPIPSTP